MATRIFFSSLALWMAASLSLAADAQTIELRHVAITFDESIWTGNKLELPKPDQSGAALINPKQVLSILILDLPNTAKAEDGPFARAAVASVLAKGMHGKFYSFEEQGEMTLVESKKISGGWACMRSIGKAKVDSAEVHVTYCGAMDKDYWVYVSMDSATAPTEDDVAVFRTLLSNIAAR